MDLINTIKSQNHRKETLVTVMDADDLYLSCTLYMVVEAFKRLKTNLILHSFTNKNDIRKANYLSGTKQSKCNESKDDNCSFCWNYDAALFTASDSLQSKWNESPAKESFPQNWRRVEKQWI